MALCLVLSLCLLTGCGDQGAAKAAASAQEPTPAAAEKSPLQTAFEEGKAFELVRADLPAEGEALGGMPLSVSPDGNAWLWQAEDGQIHVIRGGQAMTVKAAPERGAGDPWGRLEAELSQLCRSNVFPCPEGVSWSPDGRYAVMSFRHAKEMYGLFLDLILLDTETGEVFLAAAYNPTDPKDQEHDGYVLLSVFDRAGEYVYFVLYHNLARTASFARYGMKTGETEVLCELPGAIDVPGLYETADGGWTMVCATRDDTCVCFVGPDGNGDWQVNALPAVSKSAVKNQLYLHAASAGVSLLDEWDIKNGNKQLLLRLTDQGDSEEVFSGFDFGWGCPSPDGCFLLLNLQKSASEQARFVLLDPATMKTANVEVSAPLADQLLVPRGTYVMEWQGELLLIVNRETGEMEPYRLEVR